MTDCGCGISPDEQRLVDTARHLSDRMLDAATFASAYSAEPYDDPEWYAAHLARFCDLLLAIADHHDATCGIRRAA